MAKAIVIYGSTTGNTEILSQSVSFGLREGGLEITVKNVSSAKIDELADYDLVVLGASTWYDGELQDDFIGFHEKMASLSLAGKKAAAFGPGDKEGYPDTFCVAVDMLEERLKQCGAEIMAGGLKIDTPGDVVDDAAKEDARSWALNIAKLL